MKPFRRRWAPFSFCYAEPFPFMIWGDIGSKVTGASITIISTMIMAIALESFGFFNWAAAKLLHRAKGSGIRLFLADQPALFFNDALSE